MRVGTLIRGCHAVVRKFMLRTRFEPVGKGVVSEHGAKTSILRFYVVIGANIGVGSTPKLVWPISLISPRLHSRQNVSSIATTPEEEEELKRVERWVEMMADMDTEEEMMMNAWQPRLG